MVRTNPLRFPRQDSGWTEDSPHHNDGVRCHQGPSGSWLKPHVRSSEPARLRFVIFEYAVALIAGLKPRHEKPTRTAPDPLLRDESLRPSMSTYQPCGARACVSRGVAECWRVFGEREAKTYIEHEHDGRGGDGGGRQMED